VLPAGPLRAPLEFQLGLAHAILINHPPEAAAAGPSAVAEWLRQRFPGPVLDARPQAVGDISAFKGARIVAFAGIADPGRFFRLLEALGAVTVERIGFADHHTFSEADATRLLGLAADNGAVLATTEKDYVRLNGATGVRGRLRERVCVLRISLSLEERDAGRLGSLLDLALRPKRDRPGAGAMQ
jgi:tetraacyldisaccharide 4'-kinase